MLNSKVETCRRCGRIKSKTKPCKHCHNVFAVKKSDGTISLNCVAEVPPFGLPGNTEAEYKRLKKAFENFQEDL